MTPQEIKEELLKHISYGLTIEFTTFPTHNNNTEIYMNYTSKDAKKFMEKKAIMDSLSKMLVDNGYSIKMSTITIQENYYYQSIKLDNRRETE